MTVWKGRVPFKTHAHGSILRSNAQARLSDQQVSHHQVIILKGSAPIEWQPCCKRLWPCERANPAPMHTRCRQLRQDQSKLNVEWWAQQTPKAVTRRTMEVPTVYSQSTAAQALKYQSVFQYVSCA